MTAWMISAHSVAKADKARGKEMWTPERGKFRTVPVEIYYYCKPDQQLSMTAGWILWDMLMYGEHGGAAAADKAAIEKKGKDVHDWYYEYTIASFKDDASEWMDKKASHTTKSTYGIWEVGKPSKPVIDMSPPKTLRASDVIAQAVLSGVKRIYWTSCQAFEEKVGKNLTPSSQTVFTPSNFPAKR